MTVEVPSPKAPSIVSVAILHGCKYGRRIDWPNTIKLGQLDAGFRLILPGELGFTCVLLVGLCLGVWKQRMEEGLRNGIIRNVMFSCFFKSITPARYSWLVLDSISGH